MSETEKITINMNVVELGKIDLLVEEGFYQNRTDFIRAAIRTQLAQHSTAMDQITTRKNFAVGVMAINAADLYQRLGNGEMLDVKVIGLFAISDDVTPELALATLRQVSVRGSFVASQEIKAALAEAGRLV